MDRSAGPGRPLFWSAVAVGAGGMLAGAGGAGGLLLLTLVAGLVLGSARPGFWLALLVLAFLRGLGPGLAGGEVIASHRLLSEEARWMLRAEAATWQPGGIAGAVAWRRGAAARWRVTVPDAGRLGIGDRDVELRERRVLGASVELARAGEAVVILPGTPPMPRAEGPVPGTWAKSGVMGSLRVEPDTLVRVAPASRTLPGWGLAGLATDAPRRALVRAAARIEAAAGEKLPAGILAALFFGERSGLEHSTRDLFTRTGTRHLLAISGLHVGLLAALLFWPLARAMARLLAWLSRGRFVARHLELPLFIASLCAFVPLTGASPPVVRASVVIALGLFAGRCGKYGRRIDALNLWGAALLLELLFATRPLTSLSLQLSYLATLGLILGLGPLGRALSRGAVRLVQHVPGAEAWRPSWARSAWTAPLFAVARFVPLALAASLAAVAATLPIAWRTFGEVAPVGILLTPLAVPLLAWLLTLGWPLAAAVALVSAVFGESAADGLVAFTAKVLGPAGELLTRLFTWGDGLPGTPIALPPRPALLLWLPLIALLAAHLLKTGSPRMTSGAKRRAQHWLEATSALLAALVLIPWKPTPPAPEVFALDIGHGTACVLRLETGATWIFDAGTRDRVGVWRQALGPLLATWDAGAPHVILTHADRDHWSALPQLAQRRPPALWAGHVEPEVALDPSTRRIDIEEGATHLPSGRTRLTLLRGGVFPGNEGSRALLVEAPGLGRLLLTGDAEAEGLAAMLDHDSLALGGPLDVLLLPHHGSDSEHIAALLATTGPRRIWISESGPCQLAAELDRRGLDPETTNEKGPLTWP